MPVRTAAPAMHRASAAELKTIRSAVKTLQSLPMGKEALRVDARGMQMFQHGKDIYIHDTRKGAWYVAPAQSRQDTFTNNVGRSLGGLTREHRTDAIGIGIAGGAMNILMGAASIFGD